MVQFDGILKDNPTFFCPAPRPNTRLISYVQIPPMVNWFPVWHLWSPQCSNTLFWSQHLYWDIIISSWSHFFTVTYLCVVCIYSCKALIHSCLVHKFLSSQTQVISAHMVLLYLYFCTHMIWSGLTLQNLPLRLAWQKVFRSHKNIFTDPLITVKRRSIKVSAR